MAFNDSNKDNNNQCYHTDCCQCKKLFMTLVVLILTFMAGIMVGNCGKCRYSDYYYNNQSFAKHHHSKPKKMHRGMHHIQPHTATQAPQNNQTGGFVIEIDQN